MSVNDSDVIRVRVCTPRHSIDVSLPCFVTLGELVPELVSMCGYRATSPSGQARDWVVHRCGDLALDTHCPVSELGLVEGESLFLRPGSAPEPVVVFDDLPDAIESTLSSAPSWSRRHTAWLLSAVSMTASLIVPALLGWFLATTNSTYSDLKVEIALVLGSGTVCLLVVAGFIGKTARLAYLSTAIATITSGWAALLGWTLAADSRAPLIGASLGVAGCSTAATILTPSRVLFASTATITAWISLVVGVRLVWCIPADILLAVNSIICVSALVFLPRLALLAAKVTGNVPCWTDPNCPVEPNLPPGPIAAIDSVDHVKNRILYSDRVLLAGAIICSTLLTMTALTALTSESRWRFPFAAVCSALLLGRARVFAGLEHRWSLRIGGLVTAGGTGVHALVHLTPLLVGLTVSVITAIAVTTGTWVWLGTDRRIQPWISRLTDHVDRFAALAFIPCTTGLSGAFSLITDWIGAGQ